MCILGGFLACPTFVFLEFMVHAARAFFVANGQYFETDLRGHGCRSLGRRIVVVGLAPAPPLSR